MRISDWSSDVCSSDLRQPVSHDGAGQPLGRLVLVDVAGVQPGCGDGAEPGRVQGGDVRRRQPSSLPEGKAAVTDGMGEDRSFGLGERQVAEDHGRVSRRRAAVICAMIETRSEEHTSELQSLMRISYAVFCLKKNNKIGREQLYNNVT